MASMVLQDDVVADIFGFLGATDTTRCSEVCQQWYWVCVNSRCLWRQFVVDDFGLQEGDDTSDWRQVYVYLSKARKTWQQQLDQEGLQSLQGLPARVMFSDDGAPYPGFPPESALRRSYRTWCTSSGVDKDVDLVLELPQLCMINGFELANGGRGYTAPLKEALVFTSLQPIDLEAARKYNGAEGSKWAKKLHRTGSAALQSDGNVGGGARGGEPLLGFCFPPIPQAFDAALFRRLKRPVVARYIHFKLLSSYHPPRMFSTNIDVMNLITVGSQLPELPRLLKRPNLNDPLPKDPSYQRMHKLRVDDPEW